MHSKAGLNLSPARIGIRPFEVCPSVSLTMSGLTPDSAHLSTSAVRILVADDHEVMRLGIRNLLESVANWSVYAEAKSGREAVDIALLSSPDIIIMDITMPEMNGLEAAARIAAERPDIPVIMFSLHLSEDVVGRFKTGTIRGAVAKSEAARDLLEAVRSVLAGGTFFPEKHSQAAAK
jgi:DNA-binding NarL/FixJ family response regulator